MRPCRMMLGSCIGPVLPASGLAARTLCAVEEYDSPAASAEAEERALFAVAVALVAQAEISRSAPLNIARPRPFTNMGTDGETFQEYLDHKFHPTRCQ